jgi:hypothetical protein
MSFAPQYQERYTKVIEPAIQAITVGNVPLRAHRVDISKSGDSILTDIMEGIAHSRMILADVSIIGKDSVTGRSYRNGNVMYEVGLALAARQPQDVLLVRDDKDDFLFDVSTIPHKHIDFTNIAVARKELNTELMERLRQQNFLNDARVQMAIAALSAAEVAALKKAAALPPGTLWGPKDSGTVDFFDMQSTPRLLDKGIIRVVGEFDGGGPAYHWTPLGQIVANLVATRLTKFKADQDSEKKTEIANPPGLESAGASEETGKPEKQEPGNPEQSK